MAVECSFSIAPVPYQRYNSTGSAGVPARVRDGRPAAWAQQILLATSYGAI